MRQARDAERAQTELLTRIRRGESRLIETLVEEHKTALYRFLLHLAGDRALADDLFQETWLRVVENFHRYDSRRSFAAWIFSIARHAAIDHHRRKIVHGEVPLEDPADDQHLSVLETARDPEEISVLDQVLEAEACAEVQRLLAGLPWHYREVLVLRFQHEMPLEQIAEILDLPLSTVKTRVKRGLDALRRRFEACREAKHE